MVQVQNSTGKCNFHYVIVTEKKHNFLPVSVNKAKQEWASGQPSACFMENLVDLFTICHDSTAFLFPVNLPLCVPDRSHLDTSPAHPRHRCLHLWLRSRLVHTVFPSQSWDSTASVQHWNTHTHTHSEYFSTFLCFILLHMLKVNYTLCILMSTI